MKREMLGATADGASTGSLEAMLAAFADGGVGLVIPGYAYVSPEGKDEAGKAYVICAAALRREAKKGAEAE